MIRFVHTSDLQIGSPFARFPAEVGARLREARIDALGRVLGLARERSADFVLVAGDLFDNQTLPDAEIIRSCDLIRDAQLPVLVIPGNHDHGGPGSVWTDPRFVRHRPASLELCLDGSPRVVADGRAVVLPAPLLRRHEPGDPSQHITSELGASPDGPRIRIAFAHGGVIGFSDGGDATNRLDPGLVSRAELDYLALGDWHGTKKIADRVWYCGTPETDRFKANDPGHALVVTIAAPKAVPEVEVVPTTEYTWLRYTRTLTGASDVSALEEWFAAIASPAKTLVRLELSGALSFEERRRLEEVVLREAAARLRHVRRRGGDVIALPNEDELLALRIDGFVGAAVDELRARAEDDPVAARALELLHVLRAGGGGGC